MGNSMRKIVIILFSLLFAAAAEAGNTDEFFNINAGFLFQNTLNASVGYERELAYGNAYEFYAEAGNRWHKDKQTDKVYSDTFWKDYYWDGGAVYKKSLRRYKNSVLRARLGAQFGAHTGDYFCGIEGGFEYNYVFPNGVQFSVIQKNQVNFFHGDTFRNGLLVGVKIPF